MLIFTPILQACSEAPSTPALLSEGAPAPALWQVENQQGEVEAWLFGTIHSLPDGLQWRSAKLAGVMQKSDILLVEVANLSDDQAIAKIFSELAASSGLPPLSNRVEPQYRARLDMLMARGNFKSGDFTATESWAAALTLAQISSTGESANGVDRAILKEFPGKNILELEGARKQLGIFDALPEAEQRDLLEAVIEESSDAQSEANNAKQDLDLAQAWARGDMKRLAQENTRSLLADPELREALLIRRNKDWLKTVERLFPKSGPMLIAVGAAHMAGDDGLPAMLTAGGYKVTRIQ